MQVFDAKLITCRKMQIRITEEITNYKKQMQITINDYEYACENGSPVGKCSSVSSWQSLLACGKLMSHKL